MDAFESIIASILEKIRRLPLPLRPYVFPSFMVDQLQWMRDFLRDAEKFACDEQVKALVADVACDAENAIEMVMLDEERGIIYGPFHNITEKINEIKAIIGDRHSSSIPTDDFIRRIEGQRLEQRWRRAAQGWQRSEEGRRRAALARVENEVVCFVKDADVLVQRLRGEDPRRGVVSIVAPGGAGKTTLAHRIYKRSDVKTYFSAATAWIYVNDNVKELLQVIAEQVMDMPKRDSASLNIKVLQTILSNFLLERRYLIVLDGMRRKDVWDHLVAAFPDGKNGSRIMLTTRDMEVAMYADNSPENPPYELPLLAPEESWKLFLKKAFPWMMGKLTCPVQLEDTGKQIVTKCKGLPLAIEVIGGLIAARGQREAAAAAEEREAAAATEIEEGKIIAEEGEEAAAEEREAGAANLFIDPRVGVFMTHIIPTAKLGKGKGEGGLTATRGEGEGEGKGKGCVKVVRWERKEDPMVAREKWNAVAWMQVLQRLNKQLWRESFHCSDVLAVSYYDLPNDLKLCLLYLGLFPEGKKIEVEKLMMLWVAEGFVQPREEQSKEDMAKDYFLDLIGRSMIQVVEREWDGEAVTCCIHDLLRDFVIAKATKHKIFEINTQVRTSTLNSIRRLAIHFDLSPDSLIIHSTPSLRSLFCFTQSMSKLPGGNHILLRVLDLQGVQVQESVLDLLIKEHIHLKYLNLSGSSVKSLPPSVGNLYSLETLLLDYGTVLPKTIWKVHQLKHLHALDCDFEGQPQLDDLKNLHSLYLSAGDWIEENSLSSLSGLRTLKVAGDISSYSKVLWSSIEKLNNLNSLVLSEPSIARDEVVPSLVHHLHLYEMVLAIPLERLPKPHEFPPNLTSLVLDRSELEEDPMPTLEKLTNLQILQLSCNVCLGKKMISSTGGFPQLMCLTFLCLDELEEWIVERGAMPKLVHLSISVCPSLNMLPEGLQYITTLREFETWDISMKLYDRLQESQGHDWYKIQHIPHLCICQ